MTGNIENGEGHARIALRKRLAAGRGDAGGDKIRRFALLVISVEVRIIYDIIEIYPACRGQFVFNPFLEGLETGVEQVIESGFWRLVEQLHGILQFKGYLASCSACFVNGLVTTI
jgi:hypothetical protein